MSADVKTLEAKLLALQEELREAKAAAELKMTAARKCVAGTGSSALARIPENTVQESNLAGITFLFAPDGSITTVMIPKEKARKPKASANKDAAASLTGNAPNKAKPAEVRPVREEV